VERLEGRHIDLVLADHTDLALADHTDPDLAGHTAPGLEVDRIAPAAEGVDRTDPAAAAAVDRIVVVDLEGDLRGRHIAQTGVVLEEHLVAHHTALVAAEEVDRTVAAAAAGVEGEHHLARRLELEPLVTWMLDP